MNTDLKINEDKYITIGGYDFPRSHILNWKKLISGDYNISLISPTAKVVVMREVKIAIGVNFEEAEKIANIIGHMVSF